MPAFPLSSQDASDRERSLGVTPIDDALAAYLDASDALAPLRAMHGTNGTFDHDRKALLAKIKVGLRKDLAANARRRLEAKLSDAAVDDLAHAHPDYSAFLALSRDEKRRMVELESAMNAITMLGNRHNLLLRLDVADRTNLPRSAPTPEDR